MGDLPNRDHAWFRARLDPYALGLLDDAEEREFLDHARSCASCGAALRTHGESLPDLRDPHIPSRIIARWDRASRRLRGMARRLVREHLERCATCRQDLEALGFTPVLEPSPELEGESDPTTVSPAPLPERHSIRFVHGRRRPLTAWLVGGAVGAALATAAAFMIVPVLQPPAPVGPTPGVVQTAPPEAPHALLPLPPPVSLRSVTRGGDAPVTVLRVPAGTRYVQLALPDLFLADSTLVETRVLGPDGTSLLSSKLAYGELALRGTLLFGHADRPLEPGDYTLVLVPTPASGAVAEPEHRFTIRLIAR